MSFNISAGKNLPNDFNVIIEIPMNGGEVKYEFDKETGMLTVDRFLPTAMRYPCNYGFVPSTLAEDGDPVDALVITPYPLQAGSLVRVRAIALLNMSDEKGEDSKILAAPLVKSCPQLAFLKTLADVPETLKAALVHFFEHYKDLEPKKWVKVKGWEDIAAAERELTASVKRFSETTA